jgi:hypothetical protein
MNPMERFKEYRYTQLDEVVLAIRNGTIKTGKYSHLVKIDKNKKIGKEFSIDDTEDDSESE